MDIPLNAPVYCADGDGGHTTRIVLNPLTKTVTHVVVRGPGRLGIELLVPVETITASAPDGVTLRLTRRELASMQHFATDQFVTIPDPAWEMPLEEEAMLYWPYGAPRSAVVEVHHESIPPDELAVRRGYRVEATDGPIGRVGEFLIDPVTDGITHLVLREGHLWGRREVTIPVAQIGRIDQHAVHLSLDKRAVGALS